MALTVYHYQKKKKEMKVLSETTKAYLAGLIDGEGFVGVTRARTSKSAKSCKRGTSYRLVVGVTMTDRRPLDFAMSSTGLGKVAQKTIPNGGRRIPFVWNVWSREAYHLLEVLLPHLLVKREVAGVCLEFQSLMRFPGKFGLSDEEWNRREQLWAACKELNYGNQV